MTFTSALIVERTTQGSRASVKEQGKKNVDDQPCLKAIIFFFSFFFFLPHLFNMLSRILCGYFCDIVI